MCYALLTRRGTILFDSCLVWLRRRHTKKCRLLIVALLPALGAAQAPSAPRAILVDGPGPWRDARWVLGVTEFNSLLADAGYAVATVSPAELNDAPPPDVLLAVPSLESLPLPAFKAVAANSAVGGSLMASGGEPFRDPMYRSTDGRWVTKSAALQAVQPARNILDPATANLSTAISGTGAVTRTTVTGPDGQSRALDVQLQMPQVGWYLLTTTLTKPVFAQGQSVTIVWTRGTPGQSMMFEWDETDGSRWFAIVPLTSQWTKQVLLASQFFFFTGPPGRAGTSFNPAQADKLYFGVASGQGAKPGPLEFAVSTIGVAPAPAFETLPTPVLETLSPSYKQYAVQREGQTLRIPYARPRGLSATPNPDGRFRAIGSLQSPLATWYLSTGGRLVIWLPWPSLPEPQRGQLVALLRAAAWRLYLLNAGPSNIVALPSEGVAAGARAINAGPSPVQASLVWSIADSTGTVAVDSRVALALEAGESRNVAAVNLGQLPSGDYTVTASLVAGEVEVDRIESPLRVFDPADRFQRDQRIVVANGAFATANGRRLHLHGVNYWPRSHAALEADRFRQSWLMPENYDPDSIEADLTLLASMNFNLVSIQYHDAGGGFHPEAARSLVDFLDRCRNHGFWANVSIKAFLGFGAAPPALYYGQLRIADPDIGMLLGAAFLPGNDRVFAYDMMAEPRLGAHNERLIFDGNWRTWIDDQYGSSASAERIWGFAAPRDARGQISNPLDSQIQDDGPWRVMVAAYRRFVDDQLSRAFGVAARLIRRASPGTLLSYRSGASAVLDGGHNLTGAGIGQLTNMTYDTGTAAAHLDFLAPHAYLIPIPWPNGRGLGFSAAYTRYRSGGKPVYWSEYGIDTGANGERLADQQSICDSVMRLVDEDGSGGHAAWWMPGGWRVDEKSDFGILNPDGSPRPCGHVLAQWGASFAANPPAPGGRDPLPLTVDRDADARGDVGLALRWQKDYAQARQGGRYVYLRDAATGADTSTMPIIQVGNVPYAGVGPLKYVNGELGGIHVRCAELDVVVENGSSLSVPEGIACDITPALVNTGSVAWLSTTQSSGGVVLRTSQGDLALREPVDSLRIGESEALTVTVVPGSLEITGRLAVQGLGTFGETLRIKFVSR